MATGLRTVNSMTTAISAVRLALRKAYGSPLPKWATNLLNKLRGLPCGPWIPYDPDGATVARMATKACLLRTTWGDIYVCEVVITEDDEIEARDLNTGKVLDIDEDEIDAVAEFLNPQG